ncbi:MAG: helicase-exonuclease AddAB subunit AddA [Lachnospiraceae bacterium]|jgi:ATP-dependent helicase/nuclease subunit A|nr:helicase-exonuclease AddAB subunit AddA [Lachnospiraceae bacterium]
MAAAWTEEQKKVIDLRHRNILVAAAAGSGKTAVLVERILSRITDENDPVNVDELLIVTFTRAAAAQMRERIGRALKERLAVTPEDIHLQRQLTLLHYAQITTIDSFCTHVLRNHFDELDLDPDFRIGDEGELKLLRGDLIGQLMEDCYGAEDEDFAQLIETMASGKADGGIRELIEQLYSFVSAYPFPESTLREWAGEGALEADNPDKDGQGAVRTEEKWVECLLSQLHREAAELAEEYDRALDCCRRTGGPAAYTEMFVSDREIAGMVSRAGNLDELSRILSQMTFMRKPVIRDKAVDPGLKEGLSAFRDGGKKIMQKWKEQYGGLDREQMLWQLQKSRGPLKTLCRLTGEFMERFAASKKEKHLLDFTDLEHLALRILVTEEEGRIVPGAVARQMQENYREVMIDEYQDSNLVQELLLSSVAGHWRGRPNRFMVGDVKQSIYKFRMARPEIFMEKYASYTEEDSLNQKVDLHRNFRSRKEVLDSANFVFGRIMAKPLGGIDYDEKNALHAGAVFAPGDVDGKETKHCDDYVTELLLVDLEDEEGYRREIDPKEAEAKAIAGRIRRLTDEKEGLSVWDSEAGKYRTARYGDIVILLRTFTGWAESFVNVLLNAGIPAFAQSSTGYFTALEVQTVLNCLRILDNPMQDIPLASVMHSPIGGFSSEEMACVKAAFQKAGSPGGIRGMYGACRYMAGTDGGGESAPALCHKVAAFLELLEGLRRRSVYLSLHELLQHIYTDTGYYELASVMPDGAVRQANLDMLMEKALAYEKTSYYGLFDFVRYIENLQRYEVDFGEAVPGGEGGDTVRITSIHKSKGLEYPIVFVAGTGKAFNLQDSKSRILMHPDLGLAADYVDTENRLRAPTLKKQVVAKQLNLDSLGEELRVLYVAMTRAKEKLILTGTDKSLHKKMNRPDPFCGWRAQKLPSYMVAGAGSYLDWLLLCLNGEDTKSGCLPVRTEIVHFTELLADEVERQTLKLYDREQLEHWDSEKIFDREARRETQERLSFSYGYEADETLPVKLSVSELKHAAMEEDPESCRLVEPEEEEVSLPRFLQKEQVVRGASRGTVYHKVLERIDLTALAAWGQEKDTGALREQLCAWEAEGILTQAQADAVDLGQMITLGASPVMRRMAQASSEGRLFREKPFVMGLPAGQIYPDRDSEELVVVQGIIDVYWQEEDGLHLLDYKTDRVSQNGGEQVLCSRYRAQLEYYAAALSRATGLPVEEKLIYSFTLGKVIRL